VKRLSARQAVACETATTNRCRCRCDGALHGAGRFTDPDDAAVLRELPAEDPHALPGQLELPFDWKEQRDGHPDPPDHPDQERREAGARA
jgi:hypothetical protein